MLLRSLAEGSVPSMVTCQMMEVMKDDNWKEFKKVILVQRFKHKNASTLTDSIHKHVQAQNLNHIHLYMKGIE